MKTAGRYTLIYTFTYMAIGAFCPLIGRYLMENGMDGTRIGIITSAGTFAAIAASIIWGKVYVKSGRSKTIPAILAIMASVLCMLLMKIESFAGYTLCYAAMYFFQAPIMGIVDAMCVEEKKTFGISRMWGAVGYSAGVLLAGRLSVCLSLEVIFAIYVISYLASAVVILLGKRIKSDNSKKQTSKPSYSELLKNGKYIKLAIAVFFFGGTNIANNTYYNFMYTDCGGTIAGAGTAMFLMIIAEAPFMACAKVISDRITIEKSLIAAMAVNTLRFALYSLGLPYEVVAMLFVLQGFANGIALVETIRYIARICDPEITALATSVYYALCSNGSGIICQAVGGIVLENFGGCGVYAFFAIYNLAGVMLYLIFGLHKKYENPNEIL